VSAVPVFQIHWHKECDTRRQPQHPSAQTHMVYMGNSEFRIWMRMVRWWHLLN